MALIELKQVAYQTDKQTILQEVSFALEAGDYVTLTGPSGSGKSTTLKLIAGLISPTNGQILYKGRNLADLDPVPYRRQVSYCFQQPTLFDETVKDNLAFPFAIRKQPFDEERAKAALERVDLSADYLDKKITALSGGEKQRVAAARALMMSPSVILADEPTGSLDEANKQELNRLLLHLRKQYQQTIIIVTHDKDLTSIADRVVEIMDGSIR